jgi:hypothetical protein
MNDQDLLTAINERDPAAVADLVRQDRISRTGWELAICRLVRAGVPVDLDRVRAVRAARDQQGEWRYYPYCHLVY